jgi:hypothetical protein
LDIVDVKEDVFVKDLRCGASRWNDVFATASCEAHPQTSGMNWTRPILTTIFNISTTRKEKKQHGGGGGKGNWNDLNDGSMDE